MRLFLYDVVEHRVKYDVYLVLFCSGPDGPCAVIVNGFIPHFIVPLNGWSQMEIDEYVNHIKSFGRMYVDHKFTQRYPPYFNFNKTHTVLHVRYNLGQLTQKVTSAITNIGLCSGRRKATVDDDLGPSKQFLAETGLELHKWFSSDQLISRGVRLTTASGGEWVLNWVPGAALKDPSMTVGYKWAAVRIRAFNDEDPNKAAPVGSQILLVSVAEPGKPTVFFGGSDEFSLLNNFYNHIKPYDTLISYDDMYPTFVMLAARMNRYKLHLSLAGEDRQYEFNGCVNVTITGRNCVDLRAQAVMKAQVEPKLECDTLDTVADHDMFVGEADSWVRPDLMDDPHRMGEQLQTDEGRTAMLVDNNAGAEVIVRIVEFAKKLSEYSGIAMTAGINLKTAFTNGQQVRVLAVAASMWTANNFYVTDEYRKNAEPPLLVSNVNNSMPEPDVSFLEEGRVLDEQALKKRKQRADAAAKKQYAGGIVHESRPGYYKYVGIVDFASLYPSIMIAYTVCYATIVPRDVAKFARECGLTDKEALTIDELEALGLEIFYVPINENHSVCVVKSFRGEKPVAFFYKAVQKLLDERKAIRAAMKKIDKHSAEYANLDGQQLGRKMTANAAYGFLGTGPETAQFGYMALAAVVTAVARCLNLTCVKWFYERHQLLTMYGDTDSIMVVRESGPAMTLDEFFAVLEAACKGVNAGFPRPVSLEVEGVLEHALFIRRCVLNSMQLCTDGVKKNYLGMLHEKDGETHIKIRGVAGTRRDRCPAVRELMKRVYGMIADGHVELIMPAVYERMTEIALHKVPLSQLVITCRINQEYASDTPHQVSLVKRIQERTGRLIVPGTRVPFIHIKGAIKTETPDQVSSHKVDWEHYVTQLSGAVQPVLQEFRPWLARFIKDVHVFASRAKGMAVPIPTWRPIPLSAVGTKRPLGEVQ